MISFRYHIVSIVSVFLALAVGVALGGGPLRGEVDDTLVEQVEADRRAKADLRAEIAGLREGNQFTDAFAVAVAPEVVGGSLSGRAVTFVVLPGAPQDAVESLSEVVARAGGTLGGTLRVGNELLDVDSRELVDELASQLLDSAPDVAVAEDASGYERLGALLARAVGTDEDAGAPVDESADRILSALTTAELLSAAGELAERSSLVVVVGGPGRGTPEERQGANSIVTTLATALDADTDGSVVAAPPSAARADGLVTAVREDVVAAQAVSTVDSVERGAGQLVTVLALAEQAAGQVGHYGAVDAPDGVMPEAAAEE